MALFSVEIKASAEKELRTVPFPFRRQINQRLFKLKQEPHPPDAEILGDFLRVRLDRWRIVYEVDEVNRLVTILAIAG